MIFGDNREAVIKNIKKAANDRDFTAKVESATHKCHLMNV